MVEMALVYCGFLILFVGTVDLGHVVFMHQSITERAREAVRYGASRDANADLDTRMKNIVLYHTPTPTDTATPSFGLRAENVTVQRVPRVGEDPGRISVAVSGYMFRFLTPFVSGSYNGRTLRVTLPLEAP
jgi:Flp pilus assembly protein TadG